jgi:hypothetical protein
MDNISINSLDAVTPDFSLEIQYMDADEELLAISNFIKERLSHHDELEANRIKFVYSNKAKKEAGQYVIGQLLVRNDLEKMVDDRYDYIITVYYPVWKDLDSKQKLIQLDKLLCGVHIDNTKEEPVYKKEQTDLREYRTNINHWGYEDVINSGEIIHRATESAIDREKERKKASKEV